MKTYRLLLLAGILGWQPAYAIDFKQAYQKALESDPQLRAAEFEYISQKEAAPQARSSLLPELSLGVFKSRSDQEVTNSASDRSETYDTDGYSLTLIQPIYNHTFYKALDQAKWNVALSEANIESTRQELIVRVAEAYFNVLAAEDNLRFARAEKEAIGQQLEQTQKRFEVGLIAITDVKETQASYDLSIAQEIRANNQLSTTRESLRNLMGEMPETLDKLSETMPLEMPQPADINDWVETAKENNLSLKAADLSFRIAQEQVRVDRSGHYPSLNLQVSHDNSSTDGGAFGARDVEDTSITLQLNVPIYQGGLTSSKVRSSLALEDRARALQEQAMRNTVQLSRESYLGLTTAIAEVKALKQALVSTQTAYEATQAGFDVGTRTAVELLAALREQYRAERDYAQARYDYILNLLRLRQAAGILNSKDVELVNDWLASS